MILRDNTTDLVTVLKHSLEHEVKETIANELMEKYVDRFKAEVKGILVERLTRISFDKIEGFKDLMNLNQQLNVHIKVEGGTNEQR